MSLARRLNEFSQKRFKGNERYKIIAEYLITPLIASLIENSNKIYRVKICDSQVDDNIVCIKLQYERDKKPGLLPAIVRLFLPRYVTGVKIFHNDQLFVCEYYKHSFFSLCENLKTEYDNKLKNTFRCDFVIVCRAK